MENCNTIAEDIIGAIKALKEENHRLETENEELKETFSKIVNILKNEDYISFKAFKKEINTKAVMDNYQLIDLALPSGTLWMDRNIGASSPEDAGLYFAWGETQGYTADEVDKAKQFSLDDYKYANGKNGKLTKYCNNPYYGNDGYIDSLTTLEVSDDAVNKYTDGKCNMPTKEQLQELIDKTTSTWTTQNGVKGRLFTSKTNGNSIFVPADGYGYGGSMNYVGSFGFLWSSSLYEFNTNNAWYLIFYSGNVSLLSDYRCSGLSVRGVVSGSK